MSSDISDFSQKAVSYNEVVYSKIFYAFNGVDDSICAKIVIRADPDGVIRPGKDGIVPGKIQFFTVNDDGVLSKCGEFDKSGRFLTGQHWAITKNPSGIPLMLLLNTDDSGPGASLRLRRSRGTYENPTTVKDTDPIFSIAWDAHDGQSYKEVSSIQTTITGQPSLGNLPTTMSIKTFDATVGYPTNSVEIRDDKIVALTGLTSLNQSSITLRSPLELQKFSDEAERDLVVTNPTIGSLIFLINLDAMQVYTRLSGWKTLL